MYWLKLSCYEEIRVRVKMITDRWYPLRSVIKFCLTIDNYGIIQEHKIFNSFNDSKRLLVGSQCFNMIEGKKKSAMLPKSWKKSVNIGVLTPTKMRQCNNCKKGILCTTCNNQFNENKEIAANLNAIKRHPSNEFAHMLN